MKLPRTQKLPYLSTRVFIRGGTKLLIVALIVVAAADVTITCDGPQVATRTRSITENMQKMQTVHNMYTL